MPVRFRRQDKLKGTLAEELIGQAARDGFTHLGDYLVGRLGEKWPEDTGKSKKSLKKRVSGAGLKTRMLVLADADHAEWVEKGRPKGAKQPPPAAMLKLVRRKGLGASAFSVKTRRQIGAGTRRIRSRADGRLRSSSQSLAVIQKSIAFLIGRKIAKDGIPGKFLFRDLKQTYAAEIGATNYSIETKIAQLLND